MHVTSACVLLLLASAKTGNTGICQLSFREQSAENYTCQKCLEKGHFTYECTGKRKYVYRESRTREMNKKIKLEEEKEKLAVL